MIFKFQGARFKIQEMLTKPFLVLVPCTLLLITACGFHPVYGVNKHTSLGAEDRLERIEIAVIPDREGQALRNLLIDRFYRHGYPDRPQYHLIVEPISENLIDLDITKTADATRGQLQLATRFRLLGTRDGQVLLSRDLRAITSYNILAGEFATRVSEQNARENALKDLARQIESQITLYFKR